MKRSSATQAKLNAQKMDFVRDLHYENVKDVAEKKIEAEKRSKRLDIIVKMNIRENKGLELPGGIKIPFKSIKADGIIVLDNWDEIDVLLIFP